MNLNTFIQDLLQGKLLEWTRKTPISDRKIFYEINGQNAFIQRCILYNKNIIDIDGWNLFITTVSTAKEIRFGTPKKLIGLFKKETEDPIQDIMDGLQEIENAYRVKIFLMQWAIQKCLPESVLLRWDPRTGSIASSETTLGSLNPTLNDQLRKIVGNGVLLDQKRNIMMPAASIISFEIPSSAHEKIQILKKNTIAIENTHAF